MVSMMLWPPPRLIIVVLALAREAAAGTADGSNSRKGDRYQWRCCFETISLAKFSS
jgi:hypothetical protein